MFLSVLQENTKENVDLTESLKWSLLKKSVSGENLTTLESSSLSGISSSDTECELKDKLSMFVDQKSTFYPKHITTPN